MSPVDIRAVLLREMHRAIDDAAHNGLRSIEHPGTGLSYPPGVGLSDAELRALSTLRLSEDHRSALRKILRDTASGPLFQLFALLDGVADPEHWNGVWLGATVALADDEDGEPAGRAIDCLAPLGSYLIARRLARALGARSAPRSANMISRRR